MSKRPAAHAPPTAIAPKVHRVTPLYPRHTVAPYVLEFLACADGAALYPLVRSDVWSARHIWGMLQYGARPRLHAVLATYYKGPLPMGNCVFVHPTGAPVRNVECALGALRALGYDVPPDP